MKKNGFTLMEVIISCGILALFMTGVISLYTHGGKVGNTTMWLQNTINQLKLATRQINTSIQKSSYPSVIKYPSDIIKSEADNFKVNYVENEILTSNVTTGEKIFLKTTESIPASMGGINGNIVASISYHIYSLTSDGEIIYYRYEDTIKPTEITTTYSKAVPSGSLKYKTKLVKDVESVSCKKLEDTRNNSPLEITINCHMPRANTKRSETTIGVPNVDLKVMP